MTKEDLKSQMLAGIITESEYRIECEKLLITESKKTSKKSLKENIVYPSVIGDFVKTPKTDYEMAFEHFIGGKVNEKKEIIDETEETTENINSSIPNIPTSEWEISDVKMENGRWAVAKYNGKYYGGIVQIEPGSVNIIDDVLEIEEITKKEYDEYSY